MTTPVVRARVAGALYCVVFVAGTLALITRSSLANLIAGGCYIAVTLMGATMALSHVALAGWLMAKGFKEQKGETV